MQRRILLALAAGALALACGSSSEPAAKGQAGPRRIAFGSVGPWPVENVVYGAADGILEGPVVGVTSDETQNRWVATRDALYLLRPGEKRFRRYDEADGLHLRGNVVRYCDDHPLRDGEPCAGALSTGSGLAITRIVGGAGDEVFVGYLGIDSTPGVTCPPKDPARPHLVHPHTLYVGTNHGVTIVFPDRYRMPRRDEWYDLAYVEWMGDHLHARVCDGGPCPLTGEGPQRMGDWAGLAVDASGDLWHAGRWTAGLITWVPDPGEWFGRNGAAFALAFGDPYPQPPTAEGFTNEPVFKVAREGDSVHLSGVAVCPDGRVWFSSLGPQSGTSDTVAVWKGRSFDTFPAAALGLPGAAVSDVECLPDGRVVLAGGAALVLHDPRTAASKPVPGLPGGAILDVEVDRMIDPPALHVATESGAAVLRVLP